MRRRSERDKDKQRTLNVRVEGDGRLEDDQDKVLDLNIPPSSTKNKFHSPPRRTRLHLPTARTDPPCHGCRRQPESHRPNLARLRRPATLGDLVGISADVDRFSSKSSVPYQSSGDSYSDVGYVYNKKDIIPSDEAPLGFEYPGITWAEPAMPNWVGYLITEYSPDNRLLVYDYAVGGDSVIGVRKQVQVNFLPRVGEKPSWAPWNAEDTLFSKFLPAIRPSCFCSQFRH